MGTIVGAIAGQEEATCRVIDSLIRLQAGEYRTSGADGSRVTATSPKPRVGRQRPERHQREGEPRGSVQVLSSRRFGMQPQGEVLLRKCARDGSRIADGPPLAAGSLVFASHGSAMKDVPEPDAFILDRPREHYLHYGWNRHTCLGQYVSPVIIVESMVALLGLQDLSTARAASRRTVVPIRAPVRPAAVRRPEPLHHRRSPSSLRTRERRSRFWPLTVSRLTSRSWRCHDSWNRGLCCVAAVCVVAVGACGPGRAPQEPEYAGRR